MAHFKKGEQVILMAEVPVTPRQGPGCGLILEKGAVGIILDTDPYSNDGLDPLGYRRRTPLVKFEISKNVNFTTRIEAVNLNTEICRVRKAKYWRLPLFIGQLKTQEGKDELERRLKNKKRK